jgi:hypothetical protein
MKEKEVKFDPVLKQAMEEIKSVLAKYDIGGHVVLSSKSHGEFLFHFPTWSKAQWQGPEIRFKAKGKDEDGTIASTVFFFQMVHQRCGRAFMHCDEMLKLLSTKMKIEGGPKGPFPHDPNHARH